MSVDERDGDVSLEQLLELYGDALQEELAAGLIGRVERYDAATQVCDVQPVIRRALLCTDGTRRHAQMPILRSVRVEWPRAGKWFLHLPLAVGHFVGLSILDRDHAMWGQTGELSNPLDTRPHHISHAVARPGVYPSNDPIGDAPEADELVLGYDGGGTLRIKKVGAEFEIIGVGLVRAGSAAANTKAVKETQLDAHLDAIAADLLAMSSLLTGPYTPTYGTAARNLLKVAQPIGATKLVTE